MSVVGFDIGAKSCFIGVARQGGIETIANEYSSRSTPSVVSFGDNQRFLGTSGQQKLVTNLKNTVHCFKQLVGRPYDDAVREHYSQMLPYELVKVDIGDGQTRIGVNMNHLGNQTTFSMEQILGMLMAKLKTITEANQNGLKVNDCVITVPFYLTNSERAAWLEASRIAGLKCLRLFNETTATALSYGIFRSTDLPDTTAEPRRVAFIDVGYTQTQCSLVNFNKGKLQIKALAGDRHLGGLYLDQVILDHFVPEFDTKYKFDKSGGLRSNKRAMVRLQNEAEKLKKLMSANATELSLNCECLMEDKDVTGKMKRETFVELCDQKGYVERFRKLFNDLKSHLTEGTGDKQKTHTLDSVEIVGGSSRVPFIKDLIKEVFGMAPKTSLNADEAAARGGALQCAMLSKHLRVREFEVKDAQPHEIRIDWVGSDKKAGNAIIFAENESVPLSKVLTFNRKDTAPFEIKASYTKDTAFYPTKEIGTFTVNGLQPQSIVEEGDSGNLKLKVKLRMDNNGMLVVPQAVQIDKQLVQPEPEPVKEEPKEEKAPEVPKEGEAPPADAEAKPETPAEAEPAAPAEPPKPVVKTVKIELQINTALNNTVGAAQQESFVQHEFNLMAQDRRECERQDAKNAVEEFVYEQRDKLHDRYSDFATEDEKSKISSKLTETEDWLYDEGEDEKKEKYVSVLTSLTDMVKHIHLRYNEFNARKAPMDALSSKTVQVRKFLDKYGAGDESVAHIDKDDVAKVKAALAETDKWFNEKLNAVKNLKKSDDPTVFAANFKSKHDELVNKVERIMTTPKPAPPPPAEEKKEEPPVDAKTDMPTENENAPKNAESEPTQPTAEQMDLD